ncbi:hypothetical protein [Aliikangiella marina]|uniref:hypothetical protein n=1 Tax=Aliikangiella marina TaxID=1712262 RepID=UPI00163DC136|nr:hypothetical protein [Aliikangiella marina]
MASILLGIKKRSKSLKHNTWNAKIEKVFVEYENGRSEKVELKLQPFNENAWLEIDIWDDRWLSIHCWARTKENNWDWFEEARLFPNVTSKSFVTALEATYKTFFRMNSDDVIQFKPIWTNLLATGPKLL